MDTIHVILPGESYRGICTLADLSLCIKYTNKLSDAVVGKTVAELTSSLSWHFIFYSFFCFTFSFHYGFHSYLSIRCTYECTPKAIEIFRAYPNTWLWATPVFNKTNLGSILLGRRRWKPILTPTRVWVDLCMLAYRWHVWQYLKMKVVSVLFDGKS